MCDTICDQVKKEICKLRSEIHFEDCRTRFWETVDLNKDGKFDRWDKGLWFMMRRYYDLLTAPGTSYPPGYGDEGPGSSDPIWVPPDPDVI